MAYALQSHALHALPNRALLLINEYSKPLTRPDWRKSKPIVTTYRLYLHVKLSVSPLNRLQMCNIVGTYWYYAYTTISFFGLSKYLERGGDTHMTNADGIKALHCFKLL